MTKAEACSDRARAPVAAVNRIGQAHSVLQAWGESKVDSLKYGSNSASTDNIELALLLK